MKTIENREIKSNLLSLYLKNNGSGRVHSKFKNGLNVQFSDSLIYISCIGTPLSAFGLNIEEQKLKQILDAANIGDVVVNKDDKLLFYTISQIISIPYKNIEQVDLKLPKIQCNNSDVSDTKLYHSLTSMKLEKSIGIELDGATGEYIELLLNSDKNNLNINSTIINFFSGRGKGLTPSGDDILIGFTLALMMFGNYESWIRVLKTEITENTTTMISVAYLRALTVGFTSEYFIQLVKLIDEEDIDVIEETIKKVKSIGHTSGNDTLFGFSLGLKFLTN
jgi:hypothetical protein